ncbi:FecR domain-containing protein [Methylopila musalis]|uniref:FecR domain-containing protein n=1 Tax=Methylopila musalis TaxID=1134781 RepID=A0ABW3ZCX4_9HYPH
MTGNRDTSGRALDRRAALLALAGLAAAGQAMAEASAIGEVAELDGGAFAERNRVRRLAMRSEVLLGDTVWTEAASRAALALQSGSKVYLGPEARLTIDRFVAAGGDLRLGAGALVFDRAEGLPKTDIEVRSAFGLIGVRGTRFFAGPSRGVFGVFVARGAVTVAAAGVTRRLGAGEGVDIPRRGAAPSEVKPWGKARIDEALASVLG